MLLIVWASRNYCDTQLLLFTLFLLNGALIFLYFEQPPFPTLSAGKIYGSYFLCVLT